MALKARLFGGPVAQVLPHSGLERELRKVAEAALPDTQLLKAQLERLAANIAKDVAHDVRRGRVPMALATYETQRRIDSVLNCLA